MRIGCSFDDLRPAIISIGGRFVRLSTRGRWGRPCPRSPYEVSVVYVKVTEVVVPSSMLTVSLKGPYSSCHAWIL